MGKKIIQTDNNQRELYQSLDGKFPFRVNYDKLSDFAQGFFGCHWHPELEFAFVTDGAMKYQANGTLMEIRQGDGIFINTNTLHTGCQINQEDCSYGVIRMDPSLIGGMAGSSIYDNYINPILSCENLAFVYLSAEVEWQKKILDTLYELSVLNEEQSVCFELEILSKMFMIWQLLYENTMDSQAQNKAYSKDVLRMKQALLFIQESYKHKITLKDIAMSCAISKSECCRLFRKILRQSPMEYVISYRVNQSLALIASGEFTMTEIAQQTGFTSSSYFTELFRRSVGMTPTAYKREVGGLN